MSTGDNWQDLMYMGTDVKGVDRQPQEKRQGLIDMTKCVVLLSLT